MLDPSSRYQALSTSPLAYRAADGRTIPYLPRRQLPPSAPVGMPAQVQVGRAERLDQVAARTLGDSEQFWRLCDANDAMNPFDLIDEADRRLRLPSPYASAQWTSTLAVARDALQPLLGLPAPDSARRRTSA
jgi:hypothetical protein